MFDRKTARTKPFVITMMGETEARFTLSDDGVVFAKQWRSSHVTMQTLLTAHLLQPHTTHNPPNPKPAKSQLLAKVESRARIELYIAAGTGVLALLTGGACLSLSVDI